MKAHRLRKMKAVIALCLLAVFSLTSCGSFREKRPLSSVDRDAEPLVLDGPDREGPIRRNGDNPGLIAKMMPWNWFQ